MHGLGIYLALSTGALINVVLAQIPVSFALLPDEFLPMYDNTTTLGSAADMQECFDMAWAATNDTKIIEYSGGSCKLGRAIYGYRSKAAGDPRYWVTLMQS